MSKDTPLYKYYSNIAVLPLRCYVDCLVNGNYNALVISGDPPMSELIEVWGFIQQEYADAIEDVEYRAYLNLARETALLYTTFKQLEVAVVELQKSIPIYYLIKEEMPEEAKGLQGNIDMYALFLNSTLLSKFDFYDQSTYEKDLKRCINRSKGTKLEYDLKNANLEVMQQKFEHGKKPDQNYFQSILVTLSDHAGYHLTDAITVSEFAHRLNRLMKQAAKPKK